MPGNNQSPRFYFLNLSEPMEEWRSFVVTIPDSALCGLTSVNNLQPHVVRCRELIFTEPEILATPLMIHSRAFMVVSKASLYKAGRLQARLRKLGLECQNAEVASASDFEACLRYTLQARLSPLWNLVGSFLVRGREFLNEAGKLNAVGYELNVSRDQVYLTVRPQTVKLLQINLDDIVEAKAVRSLFETGNHQLPFCIRQENILNRWCHVLPSMKKGLIVEIRRCIPTGSPFKTYADIKKYWKNMYGYRLPDTEQNIFYVQISFRGSSSSSTLFTYPSCCLRRCEPVIFPSADNESIAESFMADIVSRCAAVSDRSHVAQYTTPQLGLNRDGSANNLKLAAPTTSDVCRRPAQITSLDVFATSNLSPTMTDVNSNCNYTPSVRQENRIQPSFIERRDVPLPSAERLKFGATPSICPSPFTSHLQVKDAPGNSSIPQSRNSFSSAYDECSVPKWKPVFTSKISVKGSPLLPRRDSIDRSASVAPPIKPIFNKTAPNVTQVKPGTNCSTQRVDAATGSSLQQIPSRASSAISRPSALQSDTVNAVGMGRSVMPAVSLNTKISGQSTTTTTPANQNDPYPPFVLNYDLDVVHGVSSSQSIGQQPVKKRKSQVNVDECGQSSKKPRNKPQVQQGLDMLAVLQTDKQLSTVNAATLTAWLKEHGVSCKSKDKKQDLVDKVTATVRSMSSLSRLTAREQ